MKKRKRKLAQSSFPVQTDNNHKKQHKLSFRFEPRLLMSLEIVLSSIHQWANNKASYSTLVRSCTYVRTHVRLFSVQVAPVSVILKSSVSSDWTYGETGAQIGSSICNYSEQHKR